MMLRYSPNYIQKCPTLTKLQSIHYQNDSNQVLTAVKFIGSIGFQQIELVFVCNPKKI